MFYTPLELTRCARCHRALRLYSLHLQDASSVVREFTAVPRNNRGLPVENAELLAQEKQEILSLRSRYFEYCNRAMLAAVAVLTQCIVVCNSLVDFAVANWSELTAKYEVLKDEDLDDLNKNRAAGTWADERMVCLFREQHKLLPTEPALLRCNTAEPIPRNYWASDVDDLAPRIALMYCYRGSVTALRGTEFEVSVSSRSPNSRLRVRLFRLLNTYTGRPLRTACECADDYPAPLGLGSGCTVAAYRSHLPRAAQAILRPTAQRHRQRLRVQAARPGLDTVRGKQSRVAWRSHAVEAPC
jgi:hypothetical protein